MTHHLGPKDDNSYNGWTNYETWLVNLWLSNDAVTYGAVSTLNLTEWGERLDGDDELLETTIYDYGQAIKEYVEDYIIPLEMLEDEAGLAYDLVFGAVRRVNWIEIAEAFEEGRA